MSDSSEVLLHRQRVLAEFGALALQSEDLDAVLHEACRLVAEAMGTEHAKVLEIEPGGESLLVRAGVGWPARVVGQVRLPMEERSSETFSIKAGVPVITQDIRLEDRFELAPFLKDAGVMALANVPIFLPGGRAFGLLQVDGTEPRDFDEADSQFLRTYATILGPVIDRLFKVRALRSSEMRFRLTLEGIPQLVWRAENHGEWSWASPQWTAFTGQVEEASHGWGWLEKVHPDDREAAQEAWERSKATGEFHVDYRVHAAATGTWRWFQTQAKPVQDEAGAVVEWVGSSTDVQDLKELQDRQGVLVAELQHRTRNLMAVVQALTRRTLVGAQSLEDFEARFHDRMGALARVNSLLSRLHDGDRITFEDLIRTELLAHGAIDQDGWGPQVTLDGPTAVRLRSSTVQTLALALHELATNAVKYGALAQREGRLAVRWWRLEDVHQPQLRVQWLESGVAMPEPDAMPQGGGYGRELIERALPYQLGAETSFELGPDGVRCTVTLPLSGTLAEDLASMGRENA